MTRLALSPFLTVALLGFQVWAQKPGGQYPQMTVESILRSIKRMDGRRVELQGRATFGFETSVFKDASTCQSAHGRCTLWLNLDHCRVRDGVGQDRDCISFIEGPSAERLRKLRAPEPLVLDDVILRGRLSTVRRDVSYDKSVPASARAGFGHLSAYPAELHVEQMVLQKAQ